MQRYSKKITLLMSSSAEMRFSKIILMFTNPYIRADPPRTRFCTGIPALAKLQQQNTCLTTLNGISPVKTNHFRKMNNES